jgi:hypothetical protein
LPASIKVFTTDSGQWGMRFSNGGNVNLVG